MKEHHKKESPILSLLGMGGGGTGTTLGGSGVAKIGSASGGTLVPAGITPGNGYKYHVFTSSGSFVVSDGTAPVEYLIVGGGGAGGNGHGGGGGGGGVITNVDGDPRSGGTLEVGPGTYPVTVGDGAPGDAPASVTGNPGAGKGGASSIAFPTTFTAQGGGQGGNGDIPRTAPSPRSGGSGGGGASKGPSTNGGYGGYGAGPSDNPAPTLQGYPGGQGYFHPGPTSNNPSGYACGGGGGAGAAGEDATPGSGGCGDGGAGYPVPAFAAPLIAPGVPSPNRTPWTNAVGPTGLYGGGGGGGGYYYVGPTVGAGGPGGGGGGNARGSNGQNATYGTGGGGGSTISGNSPGQDGQNLTEGNGGQGIVVIRYAV